MGWNWENMRQAGRLVNADEKAYYFIKKAAEERKRIPRNSGNRNETGVAVK